MKNLATFFLLFFVASCANYSVKTNIDPKEINRYFAPAAVKVYDDDNLLPVNNRYLQGVEGESCQSRPNLPVATIANARTEARKNAAKIGANAIVFKSCTDIEIEGCLTAKVCFAKTYLVGTN